MRHYWAFFLASSALLASCASKAPADLGEARDVEVVDNPRVPKRNHPLAPSELSQVRRERLIPLAFGREGFPRIQRYYRQDNHILDRVEYDFNGDGRIDFVQSFDETGQWVKTESAALAGDGVMNVIYHYQKDLSQREPELVMEEYDALSAGQSNVWKHYKKGQLVSREIDRHGTGHPDYWEFYENGHLSRVEKDDNSDSSPNSRLKLKAVVQPHGPEPGNSEAPSPPQPQTR